MEGDIPLRPVTGYPAALVGKTLVLADLHIGIEREYWRAGIRISGLSRRTYEILERLLDATSPKRIVVVGDLKHNVPDFTRREAEDVRRVYGLMESQGEVIIVKGNHDGDLEAILPEATIVPPKGVRIGNVFLFHGHAWPDPDVFSAKLAIMGHIHPAVTIGDAFWRYTDKCWVFTEIEAKRIADKYASPGNVPLAILPAFSPAITGANVLDVGQWIGPLGERRALRTPLRIFLLDGTYVGELSPSPQGGVHAGG